MGRSHCIQDIILVDDDTSILNELSEFIATQGRTVVASNCPLEAIKYARENHADMLITDFNMPVMNGVQLAYSLIAFHPTIRIAVMSGRMADAGMFLNDWNFLLKPFGLDELDRCMS